MYRHANIVPFRPKYRGSRERHGYLVWQQIREEERRREVPVLPVEIQVEIPTEKKRQTAEIREEQAVLMPQGVGSRWMLQFAMKLL